MTDSKTHKADASFGYVWENRITCDMMFSAARSRAIVRSRRETSGVVLPGLGADSPHDYTIYIIVVFFLFYHIVL